MKRRKTKPQVFERWGVMCSDDWLSSKISPDRIDMEHHVRLFDECGGRVVRLSIRVVEPKKGGKGK